MNLIEIIRSPKSSVDLLGQEKNEKIKSRLYSLKTGSLQNATFKDANFSSMATDANGVIKIFNAGAERMLGYAAVDVIDKLSPADMADSHELIARANSLSSEAGLTIAPGFEALVFKASCGIDDIYKLTYIRKDGSRYPAVVSVTALRDEQNDIIGYLLVGTDSGVRQQMEDAQIDLAQRLREQQLYTPPSFGLSTDAIISLNYYERDVTFPGAAVLHVKKHKRLYPVPKDRNAELERARLIAEKASQAKSDFLSTLSHELRSPLSAMLGFAQLMELDETIPTPSQSENITQIIQAGWHLLEIINEIRDLAKIESGQVSLSEEPVLLSQTMTDCQKMLEQQALARGIRMTFPTDLMPLHVLADKTRLKQVLINLLTNAIKYNRINGTVAVECSEHRGRTRISIRDTGAGLMPDQLNQLFQSFNRLGQEGGAQEGTGLGLVVVKRLVELMGGTIGVESTVGVGSVFWLELISVAKPMHLSLVKKDPVTNAVPRSCLSRPHKVLVVENNPASLKLVSQIFARYPGIQLLTASNGACGVEIARTVQPDVILMDIELSGANGFAVLKTLRLDPATAHIPVLAMSANALNLDVERGLKAGFFDYITKPFKVSEFMLVMELAFEFAEKNQKTTGEYY